MCGRPLLARSGGDFSWVAFACVHVSGLLVQRGCWPRWFPRREIQTIQRPRLAVASRGLSPVADRTIPSISPSLARSARPSLNVASNPPISSGDSVGRVAARVALAAHLNFQAIRAILLASATAASLAGLRSSSACTQPDGFFAAPRRICQITAVADDEQAAQHRIARPRDAPRPRLAGGRMVARRSPSQAAKSRPVLKRCGSGVFITRSEAVSGPTPGIAARRRDVSLALCQSRSRRSSAAIRPQSAACSWASSAKSSPANAGMSAPARRSSSRPIPAGPLAAMRPNSAAWPRIALTSCARWRYPPLTLASQHQSRLLIRRFRRHEAHVRPACRLAQRRRVGRIVLAARHIGLGELWRDQPHLVPEPRQRAGPVMRRPACLHRHQGRRQLLEERQHVSPRQLPAQRGSTFRIDPVQLKETLRRIHPNAQSGPRTAPL